MPELWFIYLCSQNYNNVFLFWPKIQRILTHQNEFLNQTDTSYCIMYFIFWLFRFAWLKFIDDLVQFIFRSLVSLAWNKHLVHLSAQLRAEKRCLLTSPFILPGTQIRGGNIGFSQNKLRFWPLVGNIAYSLVFFSLSYAPRVKTFLMQKGSVISTNHLPWEFPLCFL